MYASSLIDQILDAQPLQWSPTASDEPRSIGILFFSPPNTCLHTRHILWMISFVLSAHHSRGSIQVHVRLERLKRMRKRKGEDMGMGISTCCSFTHRLADLKDEQTTGRRWSKRKKKVGSKISACPTCKCGSPLTPGSSNNAPPHRPIPTHFHRHMLTPSQLCRPFDRITGPNPSH